MESQHTCPRCGYPGKDPRAVRAGAAGGQMRNPNKGCGTPSVLRKAIAARKAKALAARKAKHVRG